MNTNSVFPSCPISPSDAMTAPGERLPIASSSQSNGQPSWLSRGWRLLMMAVMAKNEPHVNPL